MQSRSDSLQKPGDESLLAQVQQDLDALLGENLTSRTDAALVPGWSSRARKAFGLLVGANGALDAETLRNFRRHQILVPDIPDADLGRSFWKNNALRNSLVGWRRGTRDCLVECLRILQERGFEQVLRRYPCPSIGNPHVFSREGYHYTFRWARHAYFIGLMNEVLHGRLDQEFVALDIGSSYGIFSCLAKKEHPASHHVLVDLPEQLILARYFLGSCFPESRIAGAREVLRESRVTRQFLLAHDFVLVPTALFWKLSPGSVDLVTNFGSFTEMTREYFDRYLRSEVFSTSRYFYTINRIEQFPAGYGTDLSILDFPITDRAKRLHFGVCPIFSVNFMFHARRVFFLSCSKPPAYFEYIGAT
jgi:putative sugar O-methyltransferase